MPVLPNLVRGDGGVVCDLLIYVCGVDDNALGQHHGRSGVHLEIAVLGWSWSVDELAACCVPVQATSISFEKLGAASEPWRARLRAIWQVDHGGDQI